MNAFADFSTTGVPEAGYYSESTQYWLIRPKAEWELHEEDGGWLAIGGPGTDGISWALKKDQEGIFAFYPIEGEFVWKAKDVTSLVSGWNDGRIFV